MAGPLEDPPEAGAPGWTSYRPPGAAPDMTPLSPNDAQALFLTRFEALMAEIDARG